MFIIIWPDLASILTFISLCLGPSDVSLLMYNVLNCPKLDFLNPADTICGCVLFVIIPVSHFRNWLIVQLLCPLSNGQLYLSTSPQEAQQVPVLQLLHHHHQGGLCWHHPQQCRNERVRPQPRQEGSEAQEVPLLAAVCRLWGEVRWHIKVWG